MKGDDRMNTLKTSKDKDARKYSTPFSIRILQIFAALIVVGGVFAIFIAWIQDKNGLNGTVALITGLSCLVTSALLFAMANLSEDVHLLEYNIESMSNTNSEYLRFIVNHLQQIDKDHEAIKNGILAINNEMSHKS